MHEGQSNQFPGGVPQAPQPSPQASPQVRPTPLTPGVDSLEKAKSLPDPGAALRGQNTRAEVQSPDQRDELLEQTDPAKRNAPPPPPKPDLSAFANTPLDTHPPLKPGDYIQGPHDRYNREPTRAELDAGRMQSEREALKISPTEVVAPDHEFEPNDPPIEHSAPKDVPADPRKVAESRGLIKPAVEKPRPFNPANPPPPVDQEDQEPEPVGAPADEFKL